MSYLAENCNNGITVSRSDNFGLSWIRPSIVPASAFGVVDYWSDRADCSVFHDKEYLAVDRYSTGARRGNVYVTWTVFLCDATGADCTSSAINFSQSTDQGKTWSPRAQISGSNPAICTFTPEIEGEGVERREGEGLQAAAVGDCNADQFSIPSVGSDGTIYVAFENFNTPAQNQMLLVKCLPGSDCTTAAGWTAPIRVAEVFDINYPFNTDGRQTFSKSNFRNGASTANIALDRTVTPNRLYATWFDNRNGGRNATGNGATCPPSPPAAPGSCDTMGGTNADIFVAISTDGGATWGAPIKVNQDTSKNDQWWPWIAVGTSQASRGQAPVPPVCVSYMDRRDNPGNKLNHVYASCSTNGGTSWFDQRLTDTGPRNCVDFGGFTIAGANTRFLGDYTALAASNDPSKPFFFAAWPDCRESTAAANQSDIYGAVFSAVPGPPPSPAPCTSRNCSTPTSIPPPTAVPTGTATAGPTPCNPSPRGGCTTPTVVATQPVACNPRVQVCP